MNGIHTRHLIKRQQHYYLIQYCLLKNLLAFHVGTVRQLENVHLLAKNPPRKDFQGTCKLSNVTGYRTC
jgi:hypothetical protein